MAQRVRRRAVGQAERAAQLRDGELDDARRERAAAGADEQRALGRQRDRGRARDTPRPPAGPAAITGTRARLAALAGDGHGVDAADRRVPAPDAQRLGDAQARAVEQRQHGGVAGEDPRLARLAGAQPRPRSRRRRRRPRAAAAGSCRPSGVRIAEKAEGVPWPSRSRWRAKERSAASWRMSERLSTPSIRRAARKARTSSGFRASIAESRAPRRDERSGRPGTGAGRGHRPRRSSATAAAPSRARRATPSPRARVSGAPGRIEVEAGRTRLDMFLLCARADSSRHALVYQSPNGTVPHRRCPDPARARHGLQLRRPGRARARARATSCRCRSAPARRSGVVWSLREGAGAQPQERDRPASTRRRSRPRCAGFLDWIAWYTLAPKGSALAMALKLAGGGPGRDRRASACGSPGRRRSA